MKKRILTMLLSIIMLLGLLPTAAFAASTPEEALGELYIFNGGTEMSYLSINGRVRSQIYTYYNYRRGDGTMKEIPAYCVNPTEFGVPQTVTPGESIEYTVDRVMSDPKVIGILATGYPHNTLIQMNLDNKYQAFYATKMALWCYLIPSWSIDKLTVAPGLSGSELNVAERILTAAKKTYINGTQWTHIPQPTITTAPDKDRAYPVTIDGKEYVQQVFTLHSDTWAKDLSVKIMFSDPTLAQAVGAKIVDLNNKEISAVSLTASYEGVMGSFDGTYKIIVPAENAKDMTQALKVNLDATVYKYEMVYAICAEEDKYGTLQNYLLDTDPATTMAGNGVFTPPDETSAPPEEGPDTPGIPQTALKIVKMETGTNTPLSGAVFQVVAPDGTTLGSFSTGPSGSVTIPLNENGNYTITEMVAPKYHLLPDSRTQHVKVAYGKVSTVTFENAPYGDLRIEKIDGASGDSIDGAQVQIKHIESGATYTGTTGPGGAVTFTQLTPGAYEIQELTAPTGWQKDPKTYTTNVVSGQCVTFTLKNAALPGLKIIKYDRVSHETMSGVSFRIYRDAVLLGTYETDALRSE